MTAARLHYQRPNKRYSQLLRRWHRCNTKHFQSLNLPRLCPCLWCSVRFDDVTRLIHQWQRTFVVGINNFKKQGIYLCKGKRSGRPRTSEENVHQIQETYQLSPRKSTRRDSRELTIPHVTVWRVLTHCGRVTQICLLNTVKLGTSASSPQCHTTRGNVSRGIAPSSTTRVFGEYFLKISFHKNSQRICYKFLKKHNIKVD